MVLNTKQIIKRCKNGMVTPFDESKVQPNSIDIHWSGKIRLPRPEWVTMDKGELLTIAMELSTNPQMWHELKIKMWGEVQELERFVLMPGAFVLMDTLETVKLPKNIMCNYWLNSSFARFGGNHNLAGLGDAGFSGTYTLEVFNVALWPILIEKGGRIGQLVFQKIKKGGKSYKETGRYNGQSEPQPSK